MSKKITWEDCAVISNITKKAGMNRGRGYSQVYVNQCVVQRIRDNQDIIEVAETYLTKKRRSLRSAVERTVQLFQNQKEVA